MKLLFQIIFSFTSVISFSQGVKGQDTIPEPIYDTTSIRFESKNSFYFCSKLYKIPRECSEIYFDDFDNCCTFSTELGKWNRTIRHGFLTCEDGTSLSWQYYDSMAIAKMNFDNYPIQMKKQMKSFTKTKIKFFLCGIEVECYKQFNITSNNYSFVEYSFCGEINGQPLTGTLRMKKEIESSKKISKLFQQLVKF
jgi:hypothetical protein